MKAFLMTLMNALTKISILKNISLSRVRIFENMDVDMDQNQKSIKFTGSFQKEYDLWYEKEEQLWEEK